MKPSFFLALLLLLASPAHAQLPYDVVSQTRLVSASAGAYDELANVNDSDSAQAPNNDPFNDGAAASADLDLSSASGSAYQTSALTAVAITANGGVGMYAEGYDFSAGGDAAGDSDMTWILRPTETLAYIVSGDLEAFDSGYTSFSMWSTGPGWDFYFDADNQQSVVAGSGFLEAGVEYTIRARSAGSVFGDGFSAGYASGAYDVAMTLTTVTAVTPIAADREGIRLAPNPFQARTTIELGSAVPPGSTLSIFDLQGRLVRRWSVGRDVMEWDGHDQSGRRVAAGAYLVRAHGSFGEHTARVVRLK
ncbi:MAG: hypothetical protein HKO53_05315 [Gemmatimonadetes bacterium]|nr:hypothetical protein [Gemmatimonadota bacterium]